MLSHSMKRQTKRTEGELSFEVIKEYVYNNPTNLMLSWWNKNKFNNKFSI